MPNNDIGERIASRRKQLNMTQGELAEKCGYSSYTTIAKIEAGANNLRQTKISQIAKALECDPIWLIGLTDNVGSFNSYSSSSLKFFSEEDSAYYEMLYKIQKDEKKRKMLMGIVSSLAED